MPTDTVATPWRPSRSAALAPPTLASLVTGYATSIPGSNVSLLGASAVFWAIVGLAWLCTLARMLFRPGRLALLRRAWQVWALPPLIVVLTGGLLYLDAPMLARFTLSRPALDAAARTVSQGGPLPRDDEWIGLFPVEGAERIPGGLFFAVEGAGLIGSTGFAYSPDGEPPQVGGEEAYAHLHGPLVHLVAGHLTATSHDGPDDHVLDTRHAGTLRTGTQTFTAAARCAGGAARSTATLLTRHGTRTSTRSRNALEVVAEGRIQSVGILVTRGRCSPRAPA
ncbi:hypothetical protein [Nonomuraea indica]|uniref:hypothetical protein n=1 Tax=Nonomuraea indica TaxID=1581193 RepID=UPI001182E01D|nr:hypothetical protein [Nonomuraea indica]